MNAELPIRIRPFRPEDQEAARALILDGLAEHFGRLDPAANPDLDDIRLSYVASGGRFLVAELAGQLVGAAGLRMGAGSAQIVRVSVAPGFRRRGIGRALVASLLRAAEAAGLAHVWMETNEDWAPAIALYRASGFREFDRRDGCIFLRLDLPRNQNACRA